MSGLDRLNLFRENAENASLTIGIFSLSWEARIYRKKEIDLDPAKTKMSTTDSTIIDIAK